uniref:Uncharacterized protein n=1 Tax=Utricularia reniformis TaxID=192314 RepID=A0A1Y0B428_9LAMI|nr:hypothetical protein AEK19_MT1980 [Utricularia reniformis]ART32143.1 hypothetical protein AEK19_MT1980 [Utricularia reniformis]
MGVVHNHVYKEGMPISLDRPVKMDWGNTSDLLSAGTKV